MDKAFNYIQKTKYVFCLNIKSEEAKFVLLITLIILVTLCF
jgi:hypothetical protein